VNGFTAVLALLALAVCVLGGVYGVARLVALDPHPLIAAPFTGGLPPVEHAVSRFHVRWYPVTMLFLAFDMEMIFMYPWTRVISIMGPSAVVEMFTFLAVLLAGVAYAWREGALRWT
jgi:NADH-quinone oxidoreductase subunit A